MFSARLLSAPTFATPSACLCAVLLVCGCKSSAPAADDAALTRNSQAQISTDSSLGGQPVTVTVAGGVANLNGSVLNDAQKTIAARDVAGVTGIKEVINNLTVGAPPPVAATSTTPLPTPIAAPPAPLRPQEPTRAELAAQAHQQAVDDARARKAQQTYDNSHPAPIERSQQAYNPPPPVAAPALPPAPPQPVFRNITIPSGTTVPVRVTQTLDSATTQEGDSFSGVVASDVVIDGATVLPAGATVSGHVDVVHEAAHFKGSSLLTVSLASITRRGDRLPVTTDPYSVQGKGRGTNTAEKVGGGARGRRYPGRHLRWRQGCSHRRWRWRRPRSRRAGRHQGPAGSDRIRNRRPLPPVRTARRPRPHRPGRNRTQPATTFNPAKTDVLFLESERQRPQSLPLTLPFYYPFARLP